MKSKSRVASAGLAGAFAVLAFGAASMPAQAQDLAECDSYPGTDASHACFCPAEISSGSVWGSNPYTSDSNICRAALHAGVISPDGGPVYLELRDGQASYEGSSANGIDTSSWGSYPTSFTFVKRPATGVPCEAYPVGEPSYTCDCEGTETGSVWGSDPYTADSGICAAALHAGIIGYDGGTVTAIGVTGLESYTGSDQNGISTSDWGSYPNSFVFNWN